jgi:ribosomal protein L20A (L18A)
MLKINCDFKGQNNNNAKLSDSEIKDIRKEWATKEWTLRSMATRYGVSHSQIRRIVLGLSR